MLYKFILPLGPFFHLYAKRPSEKISWCLYYLVPFASVAFYYGVNFYAILFAIALVYSSYDVGYIYNNAETIKKERDPTRRYSEMELVFYESNKFSIYLTKVFISIACAFSLSFLYHYDAIQWLILSSLIIIVFLIYNSIRGVGNFYLQLFLSTLRYSFPLFLLSGFNYELLLFSMLIFPIPNFLERTKIKKNNLPFIINNTERFRVFYYMFLAVLCTYLWCNHWLTNFWPIAAAAYFFLYRSFFYLMNAFKR
ncbi:hypothetical protein LJPFL01_2707 [Lelliottia jeotgali]|nr:hypothetical protein LJPFL01_2707 [Lelliottia jeotgali]